MKHFADISAFILAGGASSRMGREKAFLPLGKTTVIERTASLLTGHVAPITVIGPYGAFCKLGFKTIPDSTGAEETGEREGPMAGIVTALSFCQTEWCLILACDLPYLKEKWLVALLTQTKTAEADAIVPRTARGLEPLAAIYRKSCYAKFFEDFQQGVRKVRGTLRCLSIEVADEGLDPAFAENEFVLQNMNTPSEYDAAVDHFQPADKTRSSPE